MIITNRRPQRCFWLEAKRIADAFDLKHKMLLSDAQAKHMIPKGGMTGHRKVLGTSTWTFETAGVSGAVVERDFSKEQLVA